MWWKKLTRWERTFTAITANHRAGTGTVDSWDDAMSRPQNTHNYEQYYLSAQEDHVSRQLYNKDHLPLGWLSGGFSSRRLTTSGHSVARSLSLAFWFGLLESSRYSPIPTQSSDVTAWLLHGLHYNVVKVTMMIFEHISRGLLMCYISVIRY